MESSEDIESRHSNQTLQGLIWEKSLYSAEKVVEGDIDSHVILYGVLYGSMTHDAHCVMCGRSSTFKRNGRDDIFEIYSQTGQALSWSKKMDPSLENWHKAVNFNCQRDNDHVYTFFFDLRDGLLRKVGQMPSLEDISGADLEKYRKALDKQHFSDLRRAGGLASHGVGIGAFVYLRRIFEKLIFDHHKQFAETNGPIENFESLRMLEKVEALSGVLPEAALEFKQVYSILSKGVHELDEETCKTYFPVVKAIIISILEEDLQKKAKAEAAASARKAMQQIMSDLKTKT